MAAQGHDAGTVSPAIAGMTPLFDADSNARVAVRLFEHIDNTTCDQAASPMLVDPAIYSDPDVARLEQDRIFDKVPVLAAHVSELPNAGDFVTIDLPGNRVLVVRQEDGTIRAFVNVCRHRGACLVDEESGHRRVFSCGYHGWAYNCDGALRTVPYADTFGPLDRAEYGLIELPCEERYGLVWVIQRPGGPIDVAAWMGPEMDEILTGYHMERFEVVRMDRFDERMNWKVAEDAFIDGYHLKFVHPNSAGPYFYTNIQVVQDFGRHVRAITPRKVIDQIRFAPDAPIDPYVTVGNFLMPNTTILRHSDHYESLTFVPHPTDPNRSRIDVRLVVPPVTSDEERALWEKNWDILVKTVIMEDLPLNRSLQRALGGRGLKPLILGRNEVGNQAFHRLYDELMATPSF
ncbi:MAG TPA: aromatic ring-hydroxylating dioxygenase subunit alpha [Acidimicrobiia bacterium]|nr:aromatic ring-hydroxylating dioxygenase subunit alpha [Acidimicrobiia bacterium]